MYNPAIKEELIRALYQLKLKEKKPMTALANEALTEFLIKKEILKKGDTDERR